MYGGPGFKQFLFLGNLSLMVKKDLIQPQHFLSYSYFYFVIQKRKERYLKCQYIIIHQNNKESSDSFIYHKNIVFVM